MSSKILRELQRFSQIIIKKETTATASTIHGGFGSIFSIFTGQKASPEPEKDDVGQMLGCIIEDFCHCPVSSCLAHQQTHPQVREDSTCSFWITTLSRQRGKGRQMLLTVTSNQTVGSSGPKQERVQNHPFYLYSLSASFCASHMPELYNLEFPNGKTCL